MGQRAAYLPPLLYIMREPIVMSVMDSGIATLAPPNCARAFPGRLLFSNDQRDQYSVRRAVCLFKRLRFTYFSRPCMANSINRLNKWATFRLCIVRSDSVRSPFACHSEMTMSRFELSEDLAGISHVSFGKPRYTHPFSSEVSILKQVEQILHMTQQHGIQVNSAETFQVVPKTE